MAYYPGNATPLTKGNWIRVRQFITVCVDIAYKQRERERDLFTYTYIYIYIHRKRERERERQRERERARQAFSFSERDIWKLGATSMRRLQLVQLLHE